MFSKVQGKPLTQTCLSRQAMQFGRRWKGGDALKLGSNLYVWRCTGRVSQTVFISICVLKAYDSVMSSPPTVLMTIMLFILLLPLSCCRWTHPCWFDVRQRLPRQAAMLLHRQRHHLPEGVQRHKAVDCRPRPPWRRCACRCSAHRLRRVSRGPATATQVVPAPGVKSWVKVKAKDKVSALRRVECRRKTSRVALVLGPDSDSRRCFPRP